MALASGATSSPAADLHRFLRCPEHVPLRPPAWDHEPSAHRTTVPPSAMSRFQSPTQGCPSHSRFPAHPATTSAASSAGTSFPPFIATSHVDGNPENAHSVAGNRTTGLGGRSALSWPPLSRRGPRCPGSRSAAPAGTVPGALMMCWIWKSRLGDGARGARRVLGSSHPERRDHYCSRLHRLLELAPGPVQRRDRRPARDLDPGRRHPPVSRGMQKTRRSRPPRAPARARQGCHDHGLGRPGVAARRAAALTPPYWSVGPSALRPVRRSRV